MNKSLVVAGALAGVGGVAYLYWSHKQTAEGSAGDFGTFEDEALDSVPNDDTGDAVPPSPSEVQEAVFGDPSLLDAPPPVPRITSTQTAGGVRTGGGDSVVQAAYIRTRAASTGDTLKIRRPR